MRLADLSEVAALDVVRDCEFRTLGLLSHDTPDMLVCFYDGKYRHDLSGNPRIAAVITSPELAALVPGHMGLAVTGSPREAFLEVHGHLAAATDSYGGDVPSEISPDALIHPAAYVAPANVRVEAGCVVEPGALVLGGSILAEGAVVRTGAVIGAEGFHPVPLEGTLVNTPHYGSVELGPGVEVQANSVVCRAVFHGPTAVGERSILGPLVYVAHGVRIGARCRIAATARISGSARIGNDVFVGPGAVVSNGIAVGDGARISLGSVVVRDVRAGQTVTGNFAVDHRRFLSSFRGLHR